VSSSTACTPPTTVVEIRDLAVYDALLENTEIGTPVTNAAPGASGGLDLTLAEVSA
jgi:hypothetical protein